MTPRTFALLFLLPLSFLFAQSTATFTGNAVAAPTISVGPTAVANSSSSILVNWTTSTAGSSQVSCTPTAGGSAIVTPVLHPWDYQTGWEVTVHSIAATGLAAATAYTCTATTVNSGGTVSHAAASVSTSAVAATIQPAIASVGAPIRVNDQYNGSNGMPNNGTCLDGDTEYHTWADTGDFGAFDGGRGVGCVSGNAIGLLQWSSLLTPTSAANYNPPTWLAYDYGPVSIRGSMYDQIWYCGGAPVLCGDLNEIKTADHWAHSIAPSHNFGPNTLATQAGVDSSDYASASITAATWTGGVITLTSALNPPVNAWTHVTGAGSCNGDYGVATTSSTQFTAPRAGSGTCTLTSASANYMNGEFPGSAPVSQGIQPCQDYGGANGQFPCVWAANMDGWVYHYSIMGNTEGNSVVVLLTRKRVENMPLQRAADWQCYTGSQITDDGLYDTAWGPLMNAGTGTVSSSCTRLAGLPYTWIANTNVLAHMDFLPDFNRFLLSIRAPVNNFYGYGGNPVWDLGPYPWGTPVLIGSINRDLRYPGSMNGFPQPILSTYKKISSSPLVASMVWTTSGGLFEGDHIGAYDSYSAHFRNVTLVPAATVAVPRRPEVSSNSRDGHIANGLRLFYDFQGKTGTSTLKNRSPNPCNSTSALASACDYVDSGGLYPLLFDQYGLVNTGYPIGTSGGNTTDGISWTPGLGLWNYSATTPYAEALNAFTVIASFGHYPYTDTRPNSAAGYTVSNAAWTSGAGGTIVFTTNTQSAATPAYPNIFAGQTISTTGILPSGYNITCVTTAVTTTSATCIGTGSTPGSFASNGVLQVVINPGAPAEVVLSKGTDLQILRNGTTYGPGASWNVVVKGTTIGAMPCADGTFCSIAVERDGSGNVSVYNSAAVAAVPMVPTLTATGVTGAWSTTALTIGSSTQSLLGPESELLVWNRKLSGSELIHEMGVTGSDLGLRGAASGSAGGGSASIQGIVVNALANQAVVTYTAPAGAGACSWKVSTSATLSPLVPDVDPAVFSGSNTDSRPGSLSSGQARQFVIGRRDAEVAASGYMVERNLPPTVTHYYKIGGNGPSDCGGAVATGSFTTSNLPLGSTYNEDLPANPAATAAGYSPPGGLYAYPAYSTNSRSETHNDPSTGLPVVRVTMPGDYATGNLPAGDHNFTQAYAPSSNWTNVANALANDSSYASFTGSTSDWLALTDETLVNSNRYPVDSMTFSALAWCSGTCAGTNANIQIVPTLNRVTPWPTAALAVPITVTLGTSALPSVFTVAGNTTPVMAAWTPPGANPLLGVTNVANADMLTRTGTVNVDSSGNVTWASGTAFSVAWVAGSLITVSGSRCLISSAVTSQTLAINLSSCGPSLTVPVTGGAYSANNFGFLIRKQTSSTDTINLQYAKYTLTAEISVAWPSSGSPDMFNLTPVNGTAGESGYDLVIPGSIPLLYWMGMTTGTVNVLGPLHISSQGGTDGWQGTYINNASTTIVGSSPELAYATAYDNSGGIGKEVFLSCPIVTDHIGTLSITCTNLTPGSTGKDVLSLLTAFTASDTPHFDSTVFTQSTGCGISGLQNGKILFTCQASQQDTLGWAGFFDPLLVGSAAGCVGGGAPGCIIAAMSTWGHKPARWCTLHTCFNAGQAATKAWVALKWLSSSVGEPGGGLFTATPVSATLTSTPAIAPGVGSCPSTGAGCDVITVDGQPCNVSPHGNDPLGCAKNAAYGYIQDLAPGDLLTITNATSGNNGQETLVVVSTAAGSGAQISLKVDRGEPLFTGGVNNPLTYTGTWSFVPQCSAVTPLGSTSVIWDYVADPHGTNSGGTTLTTAYYIDHPTPRTTAVIGGDGWSANPSDTTGGYAILSSMTASLPSVYAAISPAFAGVRGVTQYIEAAQDHSSPHGDNAGATWFNDARTISTVAGVDGPATLVAGELYKFTSTTADGDNMTAIGGAVGYLNRKLQATLASCGAQAMIDVSSPATGNVIPSDATGSHEYCVARKGGECRTGSNPGDLFLNCPLAMTLPAGSPNPGSWGCFSGNSDTLRGDFCINNTGQYANKIAQIGYASTDFTGALARTLTSGYIRHRDNDDNMDVRVTPDNTWLLFRTIGLNGVEDAVMAARLPVYPSTDSYTRNTFVPVALSLTAPTGLSVTNAIVEFGYAENGSSLLNCTSRQDPCTSILTGIPSVSALSTGTPPFLFASEGTGGVESGLAGLACSVSCSPVLAGLSQRVMYYNVKYRNSGNTVVAQSGLQATVVP